MSRFVVEIKDMNDIPKSCDACYLEYENMACIATGKCHSAFENFNAINDRQPTCPIVCKLPDGHGRLGDLDDLAAGCDSPYWCVWLNDILNAPTIVPKDTGNE